VKRRLGGGDHDEGGGGHDGGGSMRWLLTYADMITLLTAFFIMMYSMSVLNLSKFEQVAISIRSGFGGNLQNGGYSVLNTSPGVGSKPSVLPEANFLGPAQMARQMRQFIKQSGLQQELRVKETRRGIVVSIVTDKVLFPKGQAEITPQAARLLDKVASLIEASRSHVRIEGHTDSLPIRTAKYPSNWELSTARATTVVRYLIEKARISPRLLSASGYADSRPLAPNDTEAHRAMNRRVDLVIEDGGPIEDISPESETR